MSLAQLRELDPSRFEDAADGWQRISSTAGRARDRVDNEMVARLATSQEGDGADAAQVRLRRLSQNLHYTQVESGLVRSALHGLAAELRAAKKKLRDAVSDADAAGFTVKPDGSVHWVSKDVPVPLSPQQSATAGGAPVLPLEQDRQRAAAQGYADRIAAALRDARDADLHYSRTLDRLRAPNSLDVSSENWADAGQDMGAVRKVTGDLGPGDIPKGRSPRDNAAWWKGLSEDERADYAALFPASIGALDGLPSDVRDDANRTVLAEKHAECLVRLDSMPPAPPKYEPAAVGYPATVISDDWRAWNEKKTQWEAARTGMEAIQKRLAGVEGLPQAYLLGFDPEGNGRAIIANGNPDTADHTAVYVPGTTSNLGTIGGGITRMSDLWRASDALVDDSSVSTITWLGYDAPQDIVKDAPFSHYANDGAPALNRFVDGLNASNQSGAQAHTTVIAHSYGTTLVGSAARQGDLNADDVVFAGSPGVQVGRATDMDVPRGHVWNEEAAGDAVPDVGRFGHGHREWSWSGGLDFVIPSDDQFGANQMSTDTTGHSNYWRDGSLSLKNQAAVVMGQYGEVQRDE